MAHMDCAIRVWKKAKQKRPFGMSEETHKDGRLKSAGTTYGWLALPGYRHSVPVQVALKETRWADFSEGRWGNRENPWAPEGDVRPAPAEETAPSEEQPTATTSWSGLSQRSIVHSVSVTKASSRETLASGTLQIVILTSGTNSSEDDMDVPTSPPRRSSSRDLDPEAMTDAVTTSVLQRQRVENEAAASSSCSPEGQLSEWQPPMAGNDLVGAGPQRGQSAIVPVETYTWEEVEGAVWQSARGTSDGPWDMRWPS